MNKRLTVADFFCGAGGFSEGFRQAGLEIVFALDNWEPARKTHKLNHPESQQPVDGDILSIDVERIDEIIPDVDVIIGSPPCVNFSPSNKAGKADKTKGIELITKFLQIVAVKKHKHSSKLKYWLMENVPNSRKYISDRYSFKDLGISNKHLHKLGISKREADIAIEIDTSEAKIHNSVYYGVPQKRERFVTGEFPEPERLNLDADWISLGRVLNAFRIKNGEITDPLYDFKIKENCLTDHFYDTEIPPFEWEEAKMKKQQARYYGKMPFPEDESRPSRTIMATRSIIAREAMIFSNGKPGIFRAPTIREVASIMSFPITYLFYGKDEATKYKLVGNAVCPKLAYAFAKAIIKKENLRVCRILKRNAEIPYSFNNLRENPPPKKKPRSKHPLSNFCEIVPDLKTLNFRVELDNNFPKDNGGKVVWNTSIHHATGKDSMKKASPSIKSIMAILNTAQDASKVDGFIQEIRETFDKTIPSRKKFQEQYCIVDSDKHFLTPRDSLRRIKSIVDKYFPQNQYKGVFLENLNRKHKEYIKFNKNKIPGNKIPLRILAGLYGVTYITKIANGNRM